MQAKADSHGSSLFRQNPRLAFFLVGLKLIGITLLCSQIFFPPPYGDYSTISRLRGKALTTGMSVAQLSVHLNALDTARMIRDGNSLQAQLASGTLTDQEAAKQMADYQKGWETYAKSASEYVGSSLSLNLQNSEVDLAEAIARDKEATFALIRPIVQYAGVAAGFVFLILSYRWKPKERGTALPLAIA